MAETNNAIEKLKDILSDPQQMERLAPLLEMFLSKGIAGGEQKEAERQPEKAPEKPQEMPEVPEVFDDEDISEEPVFEQEPPQAVREEESSPNPKNMPAGLNLDTITKVKTLYDRVNTQDDRRINLLTAIRPYMRENKHSKIDTAMKILRVTKIGAAIKDLDVL